MEQNNPDMSQHGLSQKELLAALLRYAEHSATQTGLLAEMDSRTHHVCNIASELAQAWGSGGYAIRALESHISKEIKDKVCPFSDKAIIEGVEKDANAKFAIFEARISNIKAWLLGGLGTIVIGLISVIIALLAA